MNQRTTRRLWAALLAAALCLGLLAGCGGPPPAPEQPPQSEEQAAPEAAEGTAVDALPEAFPQQFTFSSGAGGWRTYLTLERDGSFAGEFTDWDAGGDPAYPNGFYSICTFTGRFGGLRQMDETTYALTLEEVLPQEAPGTEWAADGTRYTAADPYGLETGTVFLLYTPETPPEGLDEDFLAWWPGEERPAETLSRWGLWNRELGYGFFTDAP